MSRCRRRELKLQRAQYLGFAQYRAELRAVVQQGFERFGHNYYRGNVVKE